MPEHHSLEGLSGVGSPTDRLFFAIFPDAEAAAQIERIAFQLREEKNLKGKPIRADRFHMTINHLGDYWAVPPSILDPALQAGATVKADPFAVVLDHTESFRDKPRNKPFVLRGSRSGLAEVVAFQKTVAKAMAEVGLGKRVEPRFTPHLTLLYDNRGLREQRVSEVRWTAREFVLVHSQLGKTQHNVLGRWPLKG